MKTLKCYLSVTLLFFAFSLVAQNRFFDDDIYAPRRNNPEPQVEEPRVQAVPEREVQAPVVVAERSYGSRDVDEYNRRYADQDVEEGDIIYEYVDGELTQRIVMFHDPSKITIAGADNVNIYYDGEEYVIDFARPAPQVSLNVGVGLGSPWHSPWGWNDPWYWSNPWYFNRWNSPWAWSSWNSPWNNPWYWSSWNRPWYGPGWGWNRPIHVTPSYSGNRSVGSGNWDRNRNPSVGTTTRTQGTGNVNSTVRSSRQPSAVENSTTTTRSSSNVGTPTTRTRVEQPSTSAPTRSNSNVSTPSNTTRSSSSDSSVGSGSTRSSSSNSGGFSSGGGSTRSSSGGSAGGSSRGGSSGGGRTR
jgi:hypothetical protein